MRHAYITETARVDETLAQGVQDLLSVLGNRYVAYYPSLAGMTGSPKAALMLGHAMYMTRVVMDKQPARKGWFWKTASEWKQVAGLSVRELETSRKVLLKAGILQEERRGMPAKLWFRVDLDQLSKRLCHYANTEYRPWSWEDRVLKALLGKPVMFYAPFAWIADSALAGVYLSSVFGRMRQTLGRGEIDSAGWFNTPIVDAMTQLQFGRRMLMNARTQLVSAGVMEEARESRMQAVLLSRLMLTSLASKIAPEANEFHSLSESDKLDCRNPTNKSCSKRVTRVAGSAEQELPEAQNKSCSFSGTSSAETATHSIYAFNTSYQHHHKGLAGEGMGNGNQTIRTAPTTFDASTLIFPDKLLPPEKQAVLHILNGSPDPQLILDELAGQMQDGHIRNAMGYLRTLKLRQQTGTFQPDFAHRVASDRQRRQEILKMREAMRASPVSDTRTPPEQARRHMADLRQRLWGKS